VRDHKFGARLDFVFRVPIFHVGNESLGGAIHIRKIHRVGADAWKLRPVVRPSVAALGVSHDFSDRAAPQSAGPELKRFVKSIVQLIPISAGDEFIDDARVKV